MPCSLFSIEICNLTIFLREFKKTQNGDIMSQRSAKANYVPMKKNVFLCMNDIVCGYD